MDYYQKTLFYQPEHSRAYNNIGIIYFRQGHANKAMETLNQGLCVIPEDLELHYNLAIMLNRVGRKTEAIEKLKRALQIDPKAIKIKKKLDDLLASK